MLRMYDFKCDTCHHHFEALVDSETKKANCPNCNAVTVDVQLSANSIKVNGAGAYTTKMKV